MCSNRRRESLKCLEKTRLRLTEWSMTSSQSLRRREEQVCIESSRKLWEFGHFEYSWSSSFSDVVFISHFGSSFQRGDLTDDIPKMEISPYKRKYLWLEVLCMRFCGKSDRGKWKRRWKSEAFWIDVFHLFLSNHIIIIRMDHEFNVSYIVRIFWWNVNEIYFHFTKMANLKIFF